jgi:ribonuclease-3
LIVGNGKWKALQASTFNFHLSTYLVMDLDNLTKELNLAFKNKDLLRNAFIHRSYLNEHPDEKLPNNERLEFLGDSVLSFVVSQYLYENYPGHPEGDLTNFRASLVNAKALSQVAKELHLGDYLLLSRGEEASGGRNRQYLLANTFEALLGAVYLDNGVDKAREIVLDKVIPHLPNIIESKLYKDFKSLLQEHSQEKTGATPVYKVVTETGPDHAKTFTMGVYLKDKLLSTGSGQSKQEAEQQAAQKALEGWEG